ncbi:MAG: DUF3048 domain-containing protein [Candidatus Altimarinota bacterium]
MSENSPESPSKKTTLLPYLWGLVGLVFLANVFLLFPSGSPEDTDESSNTEVEQEDYDRVSFWHQFLNENQTSSATEKFSLLDGLPIDPEYEESAVSVMIDNFVTARPQQSGIRSASVVYEALAEGGITRLMLVFPYQEIDRVGPVRSARDYFVDFAEEYGGVYLHAGGSPLALEKLWASASLLDLDEDERLEGETYSFRDSRYPAPHNLYFDLLAVKERAAQVDWDLTSPQQQWCFSSEEVVGTPVRKVVLNFANDPFSDSLAQFVYDLEQKHYKRFYGKTQPTPHTDQLDALQVSPKNIIVQVAPSELINGDEKERLAFHHIGTGTAFFYRNGQKNRGSWTKLNASSRTAFLDENGEPICLHPGQTWIAIVDDESLIEEETASE